VRQLASDVSLIGRLAALGFSLGVEVAMLQNPGRGPLIVLVRDTRIALEREVANHVLIGQESDDGYSTPDDA
jgi:Fe2+ transport system protein FeoA